MSTNKSNLIQRVDLGLDSYNKFRENLYEQMDELAEETSEAMELRDAEEKEYREQTLKLLTGIEKNTAVLQEISFLMRKSNDKQEETFALIVEILEIMKSETNEEVVSKYQKIMSKISQFTGDVETMKSLYSISGTIYSVVSNMIT
ncbi:MULTISPECIES: hypothetical protein [Bacillus]|uniref:hypothetical protein n=1 Tax=Bacillus TaxID=1386 RepID=UPI0011A09189|nr:hypothetical protein [Bacillus subtilis]MBR0014845.1 hypothetical protein [Bacillus subtilis]MBT2167387.1 hypothetical protein [Bacillus subtilis]MCW0117876.1 hypothetical protein [Bacillus subtilis]MDQ1878975.1 hypothetical protein [Bacillus subtilis]NJI50659.1 hypothetical protein [Bacillus subtilis]